jgi:hypothetical protein
VNAAEQTEYIVQCLRTAGSMYEKDARAFLAEHDDQVAANVREKATAPTATVTPDTLANWLFLRFGKSAATWDALDLVDREYWEHEAQAVRRAVARGGFRADAPEAGGDRG